MAACAEGADEAYDAFAAAHGRRHASLAEYELRRRTFAENVAFVAAHNNGLERTFTMALNRFADWTQVRPLTLLCLRVDMLVDIKAKSFNNTPFMLTWVSSHNAMNNALLRIMTV